jgi:ABC-2 type transport system permease protein
MTTFSQTISSIAVIAYRDILKFIHDRSRIIATFIFPVIFIGILGKSFQAGVGDTGFDYVFFTFTGVLAQTLFQSSASGIISLIEDRENDFSQEMFVSPVSRYAIIFGKITGESIVALMQSIGIIAFGYLVGAGLSLQQLVSLIPILIIACLFGASFGVFMLANLPSQRAANQIFPFIIFPMFFVSGIFGPVESLPWFLFILSRISPMTYIVDLVRNVAYQGQSVLERVTVFPMWLDLLVIGVLFTVFLIVGTLLFVRNERNK